MNRTTVVKNGPKSGPNIQHWKFSLSKWVLGPVFRLILGLFFRAEEMQLNCHPDGVGEAVAAHVVLPRHLALLTPRLGGAPLARRAQVLDALIDEHTWFTLKGYFTLKA